MRKMLRIDSLQHTTVDPTFEWGGRGGGVPGSVTGSNLIIIIISMKNTAHSRIMSVVRLCVFAIIGSRYLLY